MVEETKRKQIEDFCWSGHQCIPSLFFLFTFDLSEFRRHRCHAHHCDESPTALHVMYSIALFLFGNIIAQGPSLAIHA